MALDFNQRSFTKTADQAAIDEGLRTYMLKVYNYMTIGLMLTGFIAYFFGKASIVTNDMGTITEVDDQKTGIFSTVVQLITFIPGLAVGARRLHDTNRSGWWQLLWIVILIGWIPLLIFFASPSKNDDNLNYNKFGPEEE